MTSDNIIATMKYSYFNEYILPERRKTYKATFVRRVQLY
jgi:hypothetical protein